MTEALIILQLIARYGPEAAQGIYKIYETWKNGKAPTPEDWATIDALVSKPLVDPGSPPLTR